MPRKRKRSSAAQQREKSKYTSNDQRSDQNKTEGSMSPQIPYEFRLISGTLHQGDTRFQCPGIQCAFISLIALIRMTYKDPKSWTSAHIDSCVIDGNSRFMKHCEKLDIQPKMLMANELPKLIHFPKKSFVCNQNESEVKVGLLNPGIADTCIAKHLDQALFEGLNSSNLCLLFCGGQTIAIAKIEKGFCTFDSHSRGRDGLLDPTGTAVLIMFHHLNELVCYVKKLFLHSLQLRPSEQFELVPLNITEQSFEASENLPSACSEKAEIESNESNPMQKRTPVGMDTKDLDTSKSIESYFEDQKKRQKLFEDGRNEAKTSKLLKRNEYMKNYMKRRREKEIIRIKENDSARARMQKVRSTSEGKQNNKERSREGMRKFLDTENGKMKHNRSSSETMKKRLCTSEGRLKHNERSAESMRNMLKDDDKRLKHRKQSAEALKRMLKDDEKRKKTKGTISGSNETTTKRRPKKANS